ncbi:DUF2490 domain-containing protein [Flavobacterium sp. SUN052]|uniref:DUF2490 domain-containing protein n=1 Tax=Flavobacterium sp. SUN052 TaxID=3002441 RepID=UPI00237DD2B0|nr:DUF2490 domain-containing protein [Flavobacterium sp. SUN052]MEC4004567.1 DUF2490 domain-containing protein [Flavobacterium sp. SUN052]
MKYIFIIILFSIFPTTVLGQKKVNHQQLLWYGYYNSLTINENWNIKSEIQERQFINPTAQHQLVIRSNIERKIVENFYGSVGMTFFFHNPNNPDSESKLTVPELRPDIGFELKHKYSFTTISHRYKLEARFFHDTQNNELTGGFRFSNFRFRYQLGFDFPIKKKFSIKLKDEVMLNIGNKIVSNTFDQNRIYLGLNHQLNSKISIEIGYMNWFQEQSSGVDFYNRDIIRFSLFHKI